MRKSTLISHALFILFLFILAACRQEEPVPTAVPTTTIPTPRPTAPPTPRPDGVIETAPSTINPTHITWSPQVVASNPLPGEELPLNGAITVRFDQPMNQESVQASLSVAAEEAGTAVAGDFSWPRPDTVVFTPRSALQGKQFYRLTIDEQAQGVNGRPLEAPVELLLQTSGAPAVSQVIPADDAESIQPGDAITVMFNRPVVPLVSAGQQADLPQPLTFDPPAAGQGVWTSTTIYRFVPDPPLAGATTYNVTVNALSDVLGVAMAAPFRWQFTTLNPGIVTVWPDDDAGFIAPDSTFTVTFNMPMEAASTEAAIRLSAAQEVTDVSFNWLEDGTAVGLTPAALLEMGTAYELTIEHTAAAANGQATLPQIESFSYQTYPLPAIQGVYPRPGQAVDYYDRGISIQFASPMNWEALDGRVSIFPAPANTRYFFNEFSNDLQIDFTHQPDTTYRIVVPGSVPDPYGNTLGQPYEWTFRSGSLPPIASFNLPPSLGLLSTSFPTHVEIIHGHVAEIGVTLHNLGLPLNLLNRPYDARDYNPAGQPLRTWNLPIEGNRNNVAVTNLPLADGGVLSTGVYLLSLNAPDLPDDSYWWQNQRNLLIIADTNVVVKEMFGDVFVWVTDIGSGQPASGRSLTLYDIQGVRQGTAVSDANGFARFDYNPVSDYLEGVTVISNAPGESGFGAGNSLWNGGNSAWQFNIPVDSSDERPRRAYLYTDRPIYRPGDTVYYKGIVRQSAYGRYALTGQLELDMSLFFAGFYLEEGFEDQFTVTVRPDGTFSGEYALPENLPLGNYHFSLNDADFGYEGYRAFTVAQYRRPEFLVSMAPARPEALRGESVDVALEADYFFGGSAANLPVTWSIYEESFYPEFPGPYYCWTDCGGFYYEDQGLFGFSDRNYLGGGEGVTDADGRLAITLPADLLQNAQEGSRTVTVEATVQDLSNFPVSSRATITFHAAELYVGVRALNGFVAAGQEMTVEVKTVDWEGTAVPSQSVEVVFYQREWEPVRIQEHGEYVTFWNANDTEVARQGVTGNGQGVAQASFTPETGGSYLAVAAITDATGRVNLSSTYLWVLEDGRIAWQTDPYDKSMEIVADKPEYAVGETAQLLVQNPFSVPTQAWVTIERGRLLTQQVVTLQPNSDILQIPITADYSPNAFVTVTAVKPVTADSSEPYAEIRLGIAELIVPPLLFDINIELTAQESVLEPRDTAVFDIRTTDVDGRPLSADLSLALVDLAVLTLKPDNAPPIIEYFYFRQPYRSQTGGGLFISGEGLEAEAPLPGGGRGGGGGDTVGAETVALRDSEADDVRRDFRDTAHWQANVVTDADGWATVEIPLPDNLTTWRLHSKASTPDGTLVGQNNTDIVTTLPLLIRPITPRFLTVGDVLQIGAVVNNNTGSAIAATVSLEASGVSLNSPAEQTVNVPANGQTVVRWETAVSQTAVDDAQFIDGQAFADFTFRASGGGFSDATKPTFGVGPDQLIPIVRYNAQDIVGTAGQLDAAGSRVEAILLPPGVDMDQGSVDVTLSPSLAAALLDSIALHNNLDYFSDCPAAVADRLLPNAAVAALIDRLDVPEVAARYGDETSAVINASITQLTSQVLADGGWGWCSETESDAWITAYALLGLAKARQIGYPVEETVLETAGNYLVKQLGNPATFREVANANRQAFFLYVLAELGVPVSAELDILFTEARGLLDPYARALMITAYSLAGSGGANQTALLSDLNGGAIVSATGAHWEDAQPDWYNLGSDVRGTAMVVQALSLVDAGNALAPSAVRWLMAARTTSAWPTMHESAWSILALTEWLAATGELEANYDYGLQVNLQPTADGRFTRENIAESHLVSAPVPGLFSHDPNYFEFRRGAGDGRLYYTLHLHTAIDAGQVEALNRGIHVERVYYDAACDPETEMCDPITRIEAGQQVRVVITLQTENDLLYTVIEDPIPAGAEAVDPNLETTPSAGGNDGPIPLDYRPGLWGWWVFNRIEFRDDRVAFLANFLPAGVYQYTYFLDPVIPGTYQVMPTFARQSYFPEVNGRAAGLLFTITE